MSARKLDCTASSSSIWCQIEMLCQSPSQPWANALATTRSVDDVWAGDGGSVYADLSTGNAFFVPVGDPNLKNIYAALLLAVASRNKIVVRYVADGVNCGASGTRSDVQGIYIIPNAN
jgi:hypothetical protein